MDKHVLDVLDQLTPASESILKLRSTYDGWIQLIAYFLNGQAGVDISPEAIEGMAKLKLGLNFDPYDLLATEEGS